MTKKLTRTEEGRMIGGVCTGLGAYFGIDPVLVRLAFLLLTLGGGSGPLIYLLLLILMPHESTLPQEDNR